MRSLAPKARERRVGLARALSKLGYCSRSHAFDLIRDGRATVNGKVRRDPEFPVHLNRDRIAVDQAALIEEAKVYLAMNKPRGIVTTASDEKGRDTVYSFLPPKLPWLTPVGRLDKASEGLLLFTNDSEWAGRITDPDSHLDKVYHVQIASVAKDALLQALRMGVQDKGDVLRAACVEILRSGHKNSWLEIVLDEGKNRQIRRMLNACGIEVLRLVRVSIGKLTLGDLPKGKTRLLTTAEKKLLDDAMSSEIA